MGEVSTIGLDLAKEVFQVHGADAAGAVVFRKRLRRTSVLQFFAAQAPCRVAMEACASSHYWGRELSRLGHEVLLIPPSYVKPFVKRQKNDAADAEAICEASQRPTMRFVQIRSEAAQAAAVVFRARDLLVRQRTQIINALRGHLAEFGLVVAKGPAHVGRLIAQAEDYTRSLPHFVRPTFDALIEVLHSLYEKIALLDGEISRRAEETRMRVDYRQFRALALSQRRRSAPWPLRRRASREDATSPLGWSSLHCSDPPAASRGLAKPPKWASARYAVY